MSDEYDERIDGQSVRGIAMEFGDMGLAAERVLEHLGISWERVAHDVRVQLAPENRRGQLTEEQAVALWANVIEGYLLALTTVLMEAHRRGEEGDRRDREP